MFKPPATNEGMHYQNGDEVLVSRKNYETRFPQYKKIVKVYINNELFEIELIKTPMTCGWLLAQVLFYSDNFF